MEKKLFVGNLSWGVTNEMLTEAFSQAGNVVSATVLTDKMTGRSKGFGFVEMSTEEEAQSAINMLDGQELDGRPIKVSEARPKEDRPQRSGGYGNRNGGDRGGHRNHW
jgi:RNA recognition motif-containing protein